MLKDCLSTSIFLFNCYLCLGTLHIGLFSGIPHVKELECEGWCGSGVSRFSHECEQMASCPTCGMRGFGRPTAKALPSGRPN